MNRAAPTPSFAGVALRDINHLRVVAVIAAKHGFGPLLMRIPLARRLIERPLGLELMASGPLQVRENLRDHLPLFDAGDDLELPAAALALD